MDYVVVEGYTISLKGWIGDYDDCVVAFRIETPQGKINGESRFGKANKKGIFRTSVYGFKLKVNLEDETIELA